MMSEKDIMKIHETIQDAKTRKAVIDGQIQTHETQAKEKYGVSTEKELEELLASIDAELDAMDATIEEKTKALEEAYPWNI